MGKVAPTPLPPLVVTGKGLEVLPVGQGAQRAKSKPVPLKVVVVKVVVVEVELMPLLKSRKVLEGHRQFAMEVDPGKSVVAPEGQGWQGDSPVAEKNPKAHTYASLDW